MTTSRASQVSVESTPYYHCIGRCVRRAFLCGQDAQTGRNFDHRKQWLVDRLKWLSGVFAIDVCAYAAMGNHYHVVLRIDRERAAGWDEDEVIERYARVFGRQAKGIELLEDPARAQVIEQWRARLWDLSWFMRCLNEHIARRANREDGCKGRFWEGRFKSQALLDERALLTCMSYVDLNPVRAGVSDTLEGSDFTSIQERLFAAAKGGTPKPGAADAKRRRRRGNKRHNVPAPLVPFASPQAKRSTVATPLPMRFEDYVQLLQATGEALRESKCGSLQPGLHNVLERLGLAPGSWLDSIRYYHERFFDVVGAPEHLDAHATARGRQRVRGSRPCRRLFRAA